MTTTKQDEASAPRLGNELYGQNLVIGAYYRQRPNKHGNTISNNKLRYCGTTNYKSSTYYEFFDEKTRLFHWCEPEEMELWGA